ncbi:MAG TPA: hypothetical protein VMP67_03495 [Candidatus Limnocylindria bacterium]|nr:hypothetical protein [Candidatus Limnocylindria bacterium]
MMHCGLEAQPVLDQIQEYAKVGYTHVYLHQIGPDQEGFMEFARRQILPEVSAVGSKR